MIKEIKSTPLACFTKLSFITLSLSSSLCAKGIEELSESTRGRSSGQGLQKYRSQAAVRGRAASSFHEYLAKLSPCFHAALLYFVNFKKFLSFSSKFAKFLRVTKFSSIFCMKVKSLEAAQPTVNQ